MIIDDLKDLLDEVGVTIDGIECLRYNDVRSEIRRYGFTNIEITNVLYNLLGDNKISYKYLNGTDTYIMIH